MYKRRAIVSLGKMSKLSLAESAFIAGLPQAPSAYDPTKHFDRAKSRQETVINRMVANGDITLEQGGSKKEIIIIETRTMVFEENIGMEHNILQTR